jgi:hypothetical protein
MDIEILAVALDLVVTFADEKSPNGSRENKGEQWSTRIDSELEAFRDQQLDVTLYQLVTQEPNIPVREEQGSCIRWRTARPTKVHNSK